MSNEMTKYNTEHGEVALSPEIIRRYLVPSGTNVTDQEVQLFLQLCKYQGLNPFLREVYLVKYGDFPASIVTGKEVFTKRAMANPNFNGMEAGIVAQDAKGNLIRRDGSLRLVGENIVGGWAKVHVKGHSVPFYEEVSFDEYSAKKKDGTLNGMWASKPATMIRKVAIVHALREAFPEQFQGLYSQEEINTIDASRLPETPVEIKDVTDEVTPVIVCAEAVEATQEAPAPEPAAKPTDISNVFLTDVQYRVKKASSGTTKTNKKYTKLLIEEAGFTLELYDYESHAVDEGAFIIIKSMRPIQSREYNGKTYYSTTAVIDLANTLPQSVEDNSDLPFDI